MLTPTSTVYRSKKTSRGASAAPISIPMLSISQKSAALLGGVIPRLCSASKSDESKLSRGPSSNRTDPLPAMTARGEIQPPLQMRAAHLQREITMTKRLIQCTGLLITLLAMSIAVAQAQIANSPTNDTASKSEFQFSGFLAQARPSRRSSFSLMSSSSRVKSSAPLFSITPLAAGPNLPVLGSGTVGRLTKWAGLTSSNSFIGDTTIFEDKYGLVGIGTDAPTSKLTVAGMIETTLGGIKFPDGTIQTTAGLASIFHDASL